MVTIYRQPETTPRRAGGAGLSRRDVLKQGGLVGALVISGHAIISPHQAWGMETAP